MMQDKYPMYYYMEPVLSYVCKVLRISLHSRHFESKFILYTTCKHETMGNSGYLSIDRDF